MQAIILAAGMGKRLGTLTEHNTKCMIKVNGTTLIERMLSQLEKLPLSKVIMVIGYYGDGLRQYIETLQCRLRIEYITNDVYDKTNNIYSLWLAKEYLLQEDTILLESDLILEDSILPDLYSDTRDTVAVVDKFEDWMDGTVVTLDEKGFVESFIPKKLFSFPDCEKYYKTVNVYKFSKAFSSQYYVPFLEAYSKAFGNNEYYEQVLRVLAVMDHSCIAGKRLHGEKWYEIDDVQDLDIASTLFSEGEEKLKAISLNYGGFWRYPQLLDFCYLVNPFFPTSRLLDELKHSASKLITQYPSGLQRNSMLAAKMFGVSEENIVAGNGAAEIIKELMRMGDGTVGIIRPTFEEYAHRLPAGKEIALEAPPPSFRYTASDIMDFYRDKDISMLILINPDNPTGQYLGRGEVLRVADWAATRRIKLVVDESFADFADDANTELIDNDILRQYHDMILIKSISKSYGIPGLRLGVAASGDKDAISRIKRALPIWNINSLAESFLQIIGKYGADYRLALDMLKACRENFFHSLCDISFLRPLDSQANYIMCELLHGVKAVDLATYLLDRHNILIKGLSEKIQSGEYIRLSVRTNEENAMLVDSLIQYEKGRA